MKKITIIGTGAYGTALANILTDNGHNVIMYGVQKNQVDDIKSNHKNQVFFKDILINTSIKATDDFAVALEDAEIVILAVPTKALDDVIENLIKYGKREMHIINTAKGLDMTNLDVLSKKIEEKLEKTGVLKSYSALYGPSIAIEILLRKPACVMSCNKNPEIAEEIAELFSNEYFIVKPSTDLIGCEIAAALKNVVAIASGILLGISQSDNAQASLITFANTEIYKIAKNFGAKFETFLNFATIGDLILTSSSIKSRNFLLGLKIAKNDSAQTILREFKHTTEGVLTCEIINKILKKHKINAPFFEMMYKILYNNGRPSALINDFFKNVRLI